MIKTIFRLVKGGNGDLVPLVIGAQVDRVKNFFLRYIYAHHNARVIGDFEDRMSSVICAATGNMMSKPYYEKDTMLSMIAEFIASEWQDGYEEGRKDAFEEMGEEDPEAEADHDPDHD